jgi:hypothetical protein
MKFLVLINTGATVRKLTVSDTSETCCMQRVKKWAKHNGLDYTDITVRPMSRGCYTLGASE